MADPTRESRIPPVEPKSGPMSSFQPDEFAKTIQAQGLDFEWSRAVECPCIMTDSDQFNPACPRCQGDGWWYVNPAQYDEPHATRTSLLVKVIFGATGHWSNDQFKPFGGWSTGEGTMTMQSEMSVGYRDRFVGVQQRMGRSETLIRGTGRAAGSIVAVGKGKRTTAAQLEALRYEPLFVSFVADDAAGGTIYYPRRDFVLMERQLTEPTRLRWLPNKGPAEGARYTVHYDFRPVWVVDDSPQAFTTTNVGPARGAKGTREPRQLPTVFKVLLDFLTPARGS
jgi:hypothetical protein